MTRAGGRSARWTAAGCAALAVPLLLAGCGGPVGDPAGSPPATRTPSAAAAPSPLPALGPGTHEVPVAGEDALVRLPERPNGRVVVYAHGLDARATALLNDEAFGELADGLVAAGYAVAASDAGGDAWGDAASVDAHAALAAAVTDMVGATDVYLVAESMGGLAGAQLVTGRRIPGLRAYAGISPLCDLGSVHEEYEESIEAAYGQAVDEAVAALSPVRLDAAVPVQFWASEDDTTVDRTENADVCAAQVVADGGSAVVVPAEGEHGDPSTYDLPALLAFFESTAG